MRSAACARPASEDPGDVEDILLGDAGAHELAGEARGLDVGLDVRPLVAHHRQTDRLTQRLEQRFADVGALEQLGARVAGRAADGALDEGVGERPVVVVAQQLLARDPLVDEVAQQRDPLLAVLAVEAVEQPGRLERRARRGPG